jgi:plastocyanin
MKRLILLPALTLAAALTVAACSTASPTATTSTTTSAATAAGHEVVMEGFAFTPAELTVAVGTTVTWTNRDAARHDVVADDGTFASPLFGAGETFSFTFESPGEYPYTCTVHPGMAGRIVVTP